MKSGIIVLLIEITFLSGNLSAQEWWRSTTVYQIYPRSFYDTNGDGIGDIQGIIEKLDYIKDLGFESIWISPFFQSPQQDFGYDISDYYSIATEYGDIILCETLIQEVHRRDMKIVFDLVMNHTSISHKWFKESSGSRDNPKADWYVWRDGKGKNGNEPPTNWNSMVGGNGWQYNETRKQFYWASFLPFQPDLNYYNPEVRQAMLDVVRFWLGRGVDGFRLDIFNAIYEDSLFRDNPFSFRLLPSEENPDGFFQEVKYNINQPQSFEFATELRIVIDEFSNPKRFLVGEVFGDMATLKKFCEYNGKPGLNSVFLFKTLSTPFKAEDYREMVESFEKNFPEPLQPTYVFSNHDRKRSFSVLGESVEKSKLLALFQFTVRGIPFTYNGEEIGMKQSHIPMSEGKDPLAKHYEWIPQFMINMSGQSLNRDECRTPMQWDDSPNSGFCPATATPWLPVSEEYKTSNVKQEQSDANSLLNFYKRVIQLRNQETVLQTGRLEIAEALCTKNVFAFYRISGNEKLLVILNMSGSEVSVPDVKGKVLLFTNSQSEPLILKAWEGRMVKMEE